MEQTTHHTEETKVATQYLQVLTWKRKTKGQMTDITTRQRRSHSADRTCYCCWNALRKKCPYSQLFRSIFSLIQTEYKEIRSISPYSIRMRENTDQNNPEYGHILRSDEWSHTTKCPVENTTCNRCHKQRHFANVCKSTRSSMDLLREWQILLIFRVIILEGLKLNFCLVS